jgi:hypothetical protein
LRAASRRIADFVGPLVAGGEPQILHGGVAVEPVGAHVVVVVGAHLAQELGLVVVALGELEHGLALAGLLHRRTSYAIHPPPP